MGETLALFGNKVLRSAVRHNRVSFPAQAPVFVKQQAGEVQARIAHLYFICGWTVRDLAARCSMNSEMTRKTLNDWRVRAISSGYIQEIEPDGTERPVVEVSTSWLESGSTGIESDTRDEVPKTFSIVTRRALPPQSTLRAVSSTWASSDTAREILLDEIETGARDSTRWPSFCLRLLRILKQECLRLDFHVAAAQIDRIEATEERDADAARDLLRDLRVRMSDEERVSVSVGQVDDYTPGLLHALVLEIEASERDATLHGFSATPAYCSRLLATVKDACSNLGLRLTAAQVGRVEDAVSSGACQLGDLLRDLRNLMLDELEYKKSVDLPVTSQRHLTAGVAR